MFVKTASPRRHARTVDEWVDRAIAPLVDAVNGSGLGIRTKFSCSGHATRPDWPYLLFEADNASWIEFIESCVLNVNSVTRGQSRVELGLRPHAGVLRLPVYPGIWSGLNSWPITSHLVNPPRRLVELWWIELAELARMIRKHDAQPSRHFERAFADKLLAPSRRPWWHAIYPMQYEPDPNALPRLVAELTRRQNSG